MCGSWLVNVEEVLNNVEMLMSNVDVVMSNIYAFMSNIETVMSVCGSLNGVPSPSLVDVGDGAKADQLLKAFPSLKTEKTWYS